MMGSKTTKMSPSQLADIHDSSRNNLNKFSPMESPTTGPLLPAFQILQSPTSLSAAPRINFDRQTAYPRSQQPQLPSSELFPQALVGTSFSAPNPPQISRPSYNPTHLNQFAYQTNSYDGSKFVSRYTDVDAAANLYQLNPQKKRKKANEDDDCKRCSCKKTKCLKLYCECFSSGYYCAETCSCQECYNTPDYEDTVQGSREMIEVRNPLAFAPKIGDGNNLDPSSGKYRRGCNCKKTMCQKNYCECYQSNVGCTNVCRCEGCGNVHGKKGDYNKTKDLLHKRYIRQISSVAFEEKMQKAAIQDYLPQSELHDNPYNLSSQKSSFQFPYLQAPASNLNFYSPNGISPQNYQNFNNKPMLHNSRNYSDGRNVPKRLNLQNADISNLSLPKFGTSNSFDPNNVFNDASRMSSLNYLPFSGSQNTQIPPVGVSLCSRNENDEHGVFGGYTPPNEVKSISSSPQGQMSNSSRSLRLPSVPLFPPLTPLVDPEGCNSSEKKDDSEDNNIEKKTRNGR